MAVNPIPEGYHAVTPYLIARQAREVLEFMKRAFNAQERFTMDNDDGTLGHAEVQIGDSVVMLADANAQWPAMSSAIHLYVEDCDAIYRRALEAGGTSVQEVANQFYGDRSGGVRDPAGNLWWISTHVEDVPDDEMERRAAEFRAQTPA